MDANEFNRITGLNTGRVGAGAAADHLPCFAHRWSVNDWVNTPELIEAYINLAAKRDHNDVLVFSVTERDACWDVWKQYAKDNKRVFKVVEGGSIHGRYLCRMYIYVKPKAERKFSEKNKDKFWAR